MNWIDWEGRKRASIHIGGIWASAEPSVVRTILGSCIAVCLRDPISQVGGMNHFMLPTAVGDEEWNARYGVNAMEILINRCMQAGAERGRLEAKVFGGGHVLRTANQSQSVPKTNIEFALGFLQTEGIRVVTSDVGGYAARSVLFFTDSGRVLMKRLQETGRDAERIAELHRRQATLDQSARAQSKAPVSLENVTLF